MDFEDLVRIASRSFPQNGSFELRREQDIHKRIKESDVPDKPGVYLICGTSQGHGHLLQIGKAGTLTKDGSFKNQGLRGRLGAKQGGMRRKKFFRKEMSELKLDSLFFYWFVTFDREVDRNVLIIPAKAEADLLQTYFDDNGHLPDWNKTI